MTQHPPALRRLLRAAERVTEAEERLRAARGVYQQALLDALDKGESISSIARLFGVSRQAIQKQLRR